MLQVRMTTFLRQCMFFFVLFFFIAYTAEKIGWRHDLCALACAY